MRVMGKSPGTIAYTAEFCEAVRTMVSGNSYQYDECPAPVFMDWVDSHELPVWIAAYGPKALKMAGEVGDGLVVQLADPGLCSWFSEQAISAGKAVGRGMKDYRILSCAPVWIGDRDTGIQQTKWFPALVGNHVADIVEKYGKDSDLVPQSLTYYITPEISESFSIIGPVEKHVEKIKQLEAAGVTQFTIYLTNGSEEQIVADYGEHVIPQFT
jgi:alkanesulfonate monooxygenase SsuD/methylene tetrahydromethanopterin reductase-like flavin-dependent oxidoreductase (luciferase family)